MVGVDEDDSDEEVKFMPQARPVFSRFKSQAPRSNPSFTPLHRQLSMRLPSKGTASSTPEKPAPIKSPRRRLESDFTRQMSIYTNDDQACDEHDDSHWEESDGLGASMIGGFQPAEPLQEQKSQEDQEDKDEEEKKEEEEQKAEKAKLVKTEESATGRVKFKVFALYARYIGVCVAVSIVFFYIMANACSVSSSFWLSAWSSNSTQPPISRNLGLGVYSILGLSQSIALLMASLTFANGRVRAAKHLHSRMLINIMRSPLFFFDTTPTGRITNRFSKDVDMIDMQIPAVVSSWVQILLMSLSTIVVISISTPLFLVALVPLTFMYIVIQRTYVATSRQIKRMDSVSRSPIYSHFGESVQGAVNIRAFKQEDRFTSEQERRVDENQRYYFHNISSNRWLAVRLEFLGNIVVLLAAILAVAGRESLSEGTVGLSVMYAMSVTSLLNMMVRFNSEIETSIVAVERVQEYTVTDQERPWHNYNDTAQIKEAHQLRNQPSTGCCKTCRGGQSSQQKDDETIPYCGCPALALKAEESPPEGWPGEGKVEFQMYATKYRPDLNRVVEDISITVQGGEKLGIVGRTGAGKSSLTMGLFRIIEPDGGQIVIDGVDVYSIGLHDLRSKLTIIPQDPVLFRGKLRYNLDPFGHRSDDELWQALENAHMKSMVEELPEGLDFECTPGGENLSVGQRQLVCLARALLRKTKILILDEATAAIDMATDDLVQETIRTKFAECTVLTIAHRLKTIMEYDRILVLDKGKTAELGSPRELITKQQIFYEMAKDGGLATYFDSEPRFTAGE